MSSQQTESSQSQRGFGLKRLIKKFLKELIIAIVLAVVAAVAIDMIFEYRRAVIMENNAKAIAKILVYDSKGQQIATGSGVFISADGKLVTNFHVLEDAASFQAKLYTGAFYAFKNLVGINKHYDLAILQFDAKEVPYIKVNYNVKAKSGESVYTIGSPMGLESSLAEGIISNPERKKGDMDLIQFTAPISSGSSGGGLFNLKGNMLGITSSSLQGDLTNNFAENLNFAVPIKYVQKAMTGEDINFTENSPDYLYSQGVIYENKKEYDKAVTSFLKALQIDDKYANAYVELGQTYYETGQFDKEVTVLESAVNLIPDDPDVFSSLAAAYEDVGNYDAAIVNYKNTLKYKENDKDALNTLCLLEIIEGNRLEATNYMTQLSKVDKGLADEMGILLERTK